MKSTEKTSNSDSKGKIQIRDNGDLEKAMVYINRLLGRSPESFHYLYKKCKILDKFVERGERFDEALGCFNKAVEVFLKVDEAQGFRTKAHAYWRDEERDYKYTTDIQKAIDFVSNFSHIFRMKGKVLEKLGELEEALECYNRSLELNKHYQANILKAKVLERLERLEEALECVNKPFKEIRHDTELLETKGSILEKLGRTDEAEQHFKEARRNKVGRAQNKIYYGKQALSMGNYREDFIFEKKALELFDEALSIAPEYYEAWMYKGITLRRLGYIEEALACFDHAIELSSGKNGDLWFRKGVLLYELGKLEEAEKCFECAREISLRYEERKIDEKLFSRMRSRKKKF